MPVPIQQPYSRSIANGVTTVFPFEFYVINASDIRVSVDNVEVDSGYSISGVGNVSGGDVIFLTPPVNGAVVLLERAMPLSRQTDYQDNGDFLAETVNRDFDRIWMVLQSNAVSLGLSLSRPISGGPYDAGDIRIANVGDPEQSSDAANKKFVETTVSNGLKYALRTPEEISSFPSAATRRNRIPAFDSNGDVITIPPPSGSAADVYIEFAKPTGAGLVGTTSGKTVQQELDDSLKASNNLADLDDPAEARDNLGITYGYIGETFWHDNRAKVPDGTVAADGQQVDQVGPFADLYADVAAGNRPSCTEAEWQADTTKRGCYVLNSATGKMRLPDRNGVQSGSIKAPVMRGDGGTLTAGSVQRSGVPNLTGAFTRITPSAGPMNVDGVASGIFRRGAREASSPPTFFPAGSSGAGYPLEIDLSLGSDVFQDGLTEARMNSLAGCFVIRFAGHAQNAGELDALTLATRIESVNSDLQAKNIATNARIGYALLSVTNPALGSRTVLANPFGNNVPVVCMCEIFHATLQKWVTGSWLFGSASSVHGINSAYAEGEGIILVAGKQSFLAADSGTSQTMTANYTTPSPVRIHVWKVTA